MPGSRGIPLPLRKWKLGGNLYGKLPRSKYCCYKASDLGRGSWLKAEDLFSAMKGDSIVPNSSMYLSLIRAYTNSLKIVEAEDIIRSMQREGISPSSAYHKHIVRGYAKAGQIKEAERVYGEAVSRSVGNDHSGYQTMLRACMEWGYVEEGIAQFERIREQVRVGMFIWSAAVHLYRLRGHTDKAEDALNGLKSKGIPFLANLQVGDKDEGLHLF